MEKTIFRSPKQVDKYNELHKRGFGTEQKVRKQILYSANNPSCSRQQKFNANTNTFSIRVTHCELHF